MTIREIIDLIYNIIKYPILIISLILVGWVISGK